MPAGLVEHTERETAWAAALRWRLDFGAPHQEGRLRLGALVLVLAVLGLGYSGFTALCPCDRTPGGYLFGTQVSTAVSDWSFANQVSLCQLQVNSWHPHSINLNCMATPDGELYVSCSNCEGKYWSTIALEAPDGRIRMGDDVYPVTLTRVTDPVRLDEVWAARARKLSRDPSPRPPHWWTFHLSSRPAG